MRSKKIVLLAGEGDSTNIVYHALNNVFEIESVIVEKGVPTSVFLKKRAAKMGWPKVIGQILFKAVANNYLNLTSGARRAEIMEGSRLDTSPIEEEKLLRVQSVNDAQTIAALQRINPAVVVVNGTRIISKKVLASVPATFINMHAGINPLYRGVHGGYWALANNDPDNCGVTVHLVDTGIDTGNILYQDKIRPTDQDNFTTYPLLQLKAGLPLLVRAVTDALEDRIRVQQAPVGKSSLWSHPTLFEYIQNRIKSGIK